MSVGKDDLRKRLARLGVTQGSEFKPKPAPARTTGIEDVLDGHVLTTQAGQLYEVVHTYEASTRRGIFDLADWLGQDLHTLARITGLDPAPLPELNQFIFLDTETTGLGGAGAIPFMVGLGLFNTARQFEVHQFFLRDPSEEEALLSLLHKVITPQHAVVTFNGRNFDIPLLATRYILSRQQTYLGALANVDLLHPARRLWQRRLPSCALSALEGDILGIERTHADVPGSLIPYLYQKYLQTGDGGDMARVFYHNEQDILSMVVLAVILTRTFSGPDMMTLPVEDRLSLARWYEQQHMLAESESAYRSAVEDAPDAELRYLALTSFAGLLKRLNRREEAVPLWEYLADLKIDIAGHEELAKYYEWHALDVARAVEWTEQGLGLAMAWRPGIQRVEALAVLEHRHARLIRKLSGTASNDDAAEEGLTANQMAGDEL